MTSQNEEINKLKQSLSEEREEKRKIQADLGQVRFELDDITRAERMVRVDMEQTTKQVNITLLLWFQIKEYTITARCCNFRGNK